MAAIIFIIGFVAAVICAVKFQEVFLDDDDDR
jgi:hypothetical protein